MKRKRLNLMKAYVHVVAFLKFLSNNLRHRYIEMKLEIVVLVSFPIITPLTAT
jgi:hypothetical protein